MKPVLKQAVSKSGNPMIEVWVGNVFVCGIYPHGKHVNIISKFLKKVVEVPTTAISANGKKVRQVQITFQDVK